MALILAFSLFSGCASTIEFLDKKVREGSNYDGGTVNSSGFFRKSQVSYFPQRPENCPDSTVKDHDCEYWKRPQSDYDVEFYTRGMDGKPVWIEGADFQN